MIPFCFHSGLVIALLRFDYTPKIYNTAFFVNELLDSGAWKTFRDRTLALLLAAKLFKSVLFNLKHMRIWCPYLIIRTNQILTNFRDSTNIVWLIIFNNTFQKNSYFPSTTRTLGHWHDKPLKFNVGKYKPLMHYQPFFPKEWFQLLIQTSFESISPNLNLSTTNLRPDYDLLNYRLWCGTTHHFINSPLHLVAPRITIISQLDV